MADRKAATLLLIACLCDFFPSAKIKNIIFTEEAKAKLLAEQRNKKKDHGTSFVPTNIAVNYVQHNRCESCQSVNIDLNVNRRGQQKVMRGERLVKHVNVFFQSIMRIRMRHRGTTDTEKSPKQGRCVWETLRNLVQRVRDRTQLHTVPYCATRLDNTVIITLNTLEQRSI